MAHVRDMLSVVPNRYWMLKRPGHPRGGTTGLVYEHVVIAETALGHYLPKNAEVHHVDGNSRNNTPSNLVICQDRGYHMLLHQRTRVVRAGGNPNTQLVCGICKVVKDMDDFKASTLGRSGRQGHCAECGRAYCRNRRNIKKIVTWAEQQADR